MKFQFEFIFVLQEDDLKWVEENIPSTLIDKYVFLNALLMWAGGFWLSHATFSHYLPAKPL